MRPLPRFALNHMTAPRLDIAAFFDLARKLGITEVEIRNDLGGDGVAGGLSADRVRALAASAGLSILSINALQRFNDWNDDRAAEAIELADYADACGAKALVLVPVNDGSGRANGERQGNLRIALKALHPILKARGLTGLIEPLGFEICSLRSKREAKEAISAIGADQTFGLIHDTFHHCLAEEPELFCAATGLVHISGVADPGARVADLRDPHRALVDGRDRLNNVGQIHALIQGGYAGPFSFELFADEVHQRDDIEAALIDSMNFIRAALARREAVSVY
jgi:2-keto-myo-inositol isomerase